MVKAIVSRASAASPAINTFVAIRLPRTMSTHRGISELLLSQTQVVIVVVVVQLHLGHRVGCIATVASWRDGLGVEKTRRMSGNHIRNVIHDRWLFRAASSRSKDRDVTPTRDPSFANKPQTNSPIIHLGSSKRRSLLAIFSNLRVGESDFEVLDRSI